MDPNPEVLADGAVLGDRFVALVGEPDSPGWVPAGRLFGTGLPAALTAVGRTRGTDLPAVAATLLFEQYAQRLVAPVLAAFYRDGHLLDTRLPAVRAELADGTLRRLAFAHDPTPAGSDPAAALTQLTAGLLADHLDHVAHALHRRTRAGLRVLHGAVANAVASTFLHMSWPHDDRARYLPEARTFLDRVPGLAALVTIDAVHEAGQAWMFTDRNTCCLAFRTTVNQARDQPYCGTCPVLPPPTTRALFAQATAAYAARHLRP